MRYHFGSGGVYRPHITVRPQGSVYPSIQFNRFDQAAYRGRVDDDADDLTPTWITTQDTDWTQDADVTFRIRVGYNEIGGTGKNNVATRLEFNHEDGGWTDVGGASSPVHAELSVGGRSNGDHNTVSYLTGMTGSWDTTNSGFSSLTGLAGGIGHNVPANGFVEVEYNLLIDSGAVTDEDTILFRVQGMDAYSVPVVTLTVNIPANPVVGEGTFTVTGEGSIAATAAATGEAPVILTGEGVATAAGSLTGEASLFLTTEGVSSSKGPLSGEASIFLTGEGSLAGIGGLIGETLLALTGEGRMAAVAALLGEGLIVLTGEGVSTATGTLTAEGLLVITGEGIATEPSEAALTGEATISIRAEGSILADASLAGEATFVLSGEGIAAAIAALAGEASLEITGEGSALGLHSIEGEGTIVLSAEGIAQGMAALGGEALLFLSGEGAPSADATLTGEGILVLTAEGLAIDSSGVGPGAMTGEATIILTGEAALSATRGITGEALISLLANARARHSTISDRTITLRVPVTLGKDGKIRVMVQRTEGSDPIRLLDESSLSIKGG